MPDRDDSDAPIPAESSGTVPGSRSLELEEGRYDHPVPFLILDDFLPPDHLSTFLEYTLAHERDFVASGVVDPRHSTASPDPEYRRSRVLYQLGSQREVITRRIESSFARILDELRRPPFPTRHIETQLIATNEAEFFKRHTDNGYDKIRTRELTFVYYFYREPKAFSGGELRLYPALVREILTRRPVTSETIAPLQNRMMFFPSSTMHEVLPVRCPSGAFADGRFSVTGWIHK